MNTRQIAEELAKAGFTDITIEDIERLCKILDREDQVKLAAKPARWPVWSKLRNTYPAKPKYPWEIEINKN